MQLSFQTWKPCRWSEFWISCNIYQMKSRSAVTPSKKPKYNKPRVPAKSLTFVDLTTTPRRSVTASRSTPVHNVSPLASAFSSTDDTPSCVIHIRTLLLLTDLLYQAVLLWWS
jgi:hypothetical protein